jgi:hypothetical protein
MEALAQAIMYLRFYFLVGLALFKIDDRIFNCSQVASLAVLKSRIRQTHPCSDPFFPIAVAITNCQ